MSTASDWFDAIITEAQVPAESLKDKLKAKKSKPAPIEASPAKEFTVCPESGPMEGKEVNRLECSERECFPCPAWQWEPHDREIDL